MNSDARFETPVPSTSDTISVLPQPQPSVSMLVQDPFHPQTGDSLALPSENVATAFGLGSRVDDKPVDVTLLSNDNVLFFVHRHRLLDRSTNNFDGLLPPRSLQRSNQLLAAIPVRQSADILNLVLHTIYALLAHTYQPSLECLCGAVDALKRYGMQPERFLASGTHLHEIVLTIAPVYPMEAYALAAENNLEALAVAVSAYTLRTPAHRISEQLAQRMGNHYMYRLFQLHGDRIDTLKTLLDVKLFPHVPTPHCSPMRRQVVGRAFELATAQVFYNASPALSKTSIETTMDGLIKDIDCPDCRQVLGNHVQELVTKWVLSRRTI